MKVKFYLWSLLTFVAMSLAAVGCSDDDDVKPGPEPPAGGLSLEVGVENVTAHGADLKVVPSDKTRTYYADVAPAAKFAGQSEEALINMIVAQIDIADLVKGDTFIPASSMQLDAKTDYVFFALGYSEDGTVTSKLARRQFTTLGDEERPDPDTKNPEVEFTVLAGLADGSAKDSAVTIKAKCTSQDASYAAVLVDSEGLLDKFVAEGNTLESIMDANGEAAQKFEKAWLDQMNLKDAESPEGVVLNLNGVASGTRYDMLLDVKNDKGGRVVKRSECTTENRNTKVQMIDEAFFIENIWDFKTNKDWKYEGSKPVVIDFFATWCGPCKKMTPILDKCSFDYDGRVSIYQLDVDRNRPVFNAVCNLSQHDGGIPFFWFINSEGKVTKFVGATSEQNFRKLIDSILNGAPEPVADPVVTLQGVFNASKNGIVYTMQCVSKDASYAAYCIATQAEMDRVLTENKISIEQIMDIPDNCHVLPEDAVAAINAEGLELLFDQGTPGEKYAFVLDVQNNGGRTVKRCDTAYEEIKYEEGATVSDVRANGVSVHMEIPAAVKERGNAVRWNRASLPMYNMLKQQGTADADLLMQNGGQFLTESGEIHMDEEHSVVTDPATGEEFTIGDPLCPGEPVVFLAGEFAWGESIFGWGEGYYNWMFDYDRWAEEMGGGGIMMTPRPGTVRAIDPEEAKYWTGYYEARMLKTKEPVAFDGQVKFSTVDMTPIQGTLRFEPDASVKRYCVLLMDDDTYNTLLLPMLDNNTEYLQWFTTSYFAFQQLGVMAFEEGVDLNLTDWAGNLGPGMKFHVCVTAMGDADGMLQSFAKHEIVMPERTKPAPVIKTTVIPDPMTGEYSPYEVWFNVKTVEGEVTSVKYAANYKRDFDYMLTHGYDYYTLVDEKGNPFSNAELDKVNSPEGLNVKFDVRPFSTTVLSAVAYNSEGLGSEAAWAEATAAELPAGDRVESEYFQTLQGDWTASAIISRFDYQNGVWVPDTEPTKFKVSISDGISGYPETLPAEVYALYEGMSKEQVDALYAQFKERAVIYNDRLRQGNCLQCGGFGYDPKGRLDYMSPYDLFTSETYSASSNEGLFEDFGPKWYIKVNADGTLSVPFNVSFMNPLCAWNMQYGRKDMYYLVGMSEKDFIGITQNPRDPWDEFPVEVSADGKTLVVKPIVRDNNEGVATTYYPSVMNHMQDYRPIDAGMVVSEITLTKGWTEPASAAMNRNVKYASEPIVSANGLELVEKNYTLLQRTFFEKGAKAKTFKNVTCTQLNGKQFAEKMNTLVRETSAKFRTIHEQQPVRREARALTNAADGGRVNMTPLMLNKAYMPELNIERDENTLTVKDVKLNGNIRRLPGRFL